MVRLCRRAFFRPVEFTESCYADTKIGIVGDNIAINAGRWLARQQDAVTISRIGNHHVLSGIVLVLGNHLALSQCASDSGKVPGAASHDNDACVRIASPDRRAVYGRNTRIEREILGPMTEPFAARRMVSCRRYRAHEVRHIDPYTPDYVAGIPARSPRNRNRLYQPRCQMIEP
tara:strand:- start:318 stop:839 length:522 start_codon:yes stop_codon:yes gene_type:complete